MNKNRYRKIFSQRLGILIAVAESTASQGKQPGEQCASGDGGESNGVASGIISALKALPLAFLLMDATAMAGNLPTGGVVVTGQANIAPENANKLGITQQSQRMVVDWNTFNIGKSNTVQFYQPNAQAQALNVVTGGVASNIQGALLANGQVLIQNANGILFGSGSVINVGGLLATTKNIDTNAFMNGGALDLNSTGIHAGIVNAGNISATGYVTLVGDTVRNSGNISTGQGGQVTLAAGDSATVALANGQGVQLTLTNATANALIENSGTIQAQNGAVLLTARGSNTLLNTVINISGVVQAGAVVADAGNTGDVAITGTINVSNNNPGGVGGTVVLSGDRVGVFDNAVINADGDAQGGKVIIGGDSLDNLQNSSAAGLISQVNFANYTQIDSGAVISAGSAQGDGGFVETSGHFLSVQGSIIASAPNGKAGEWLIDPTDVEISTDVDNNYTNSSAIFSPSGATTAIVNNETISSTLNAGTNVTITTVGSTGTAAGNITQDTGADINVSNVDEVALTLQAGGNITLNGNIAEVSTGKLDLNLTADAGNNGNGAVVQAVNKVIDLGGGSLTIFGNTTALSGTNGTAVSLQGNITNIGGGNITGWANGGDGVDIPGNLNLCNGADVVINNGNTTLLSNAALNITGVSNSGVGAGVNSTGVVINGTTIPPLDNVTLNNSGSSNSGGGVVDSSSSNSGSGIVVSNGSNTTGTVSNGTSTSGGDNGTTNIASNSGSNGTGTAINGTTTTGNDTLNISGGSNNSSSIVASNGSNNNATGSNSTTNITGNSGGSNDTSGDSNDTSGGATGAAGPTGATGTGATGTGVTGTVGTTGPTGAASTTDTANPTGATGATSVSSASGGGGSSNSHGGAIAAGVVVVGGLGGFAWYEMSHSAKSSAPQALNVESGDAPASALQSVQINNDTAVVDVQTPSGVVEQHFVYRDAADGVKHFASDNPATQAHAELSFNPQSHEYFYREQGLNNGKPYAVTSHGWLQEPVQVGMR